jgi:hypothetical protein
VVVVTAEIIGIAREKDQDAARGGCRDTGIQYVSSGAFSTSSNPRKK